MEAIEILAPIQEQYADQVSWADLIVYAGSVAVEEAGAPEVPFCPGRVDAEEGARETSADLSSPHLLPGPSGGCSRQHQGTALHYYYHRMILWCAL